MNKITGNYSRIRYFTSPKERMAEASILGGCGNSVSAAYSYAAVFGKGIAAVNSNTFHVECLNPINTPEYVGITFKNGTIFFVTPASPALPAKAYPLYIQTP